MIDLEKINERKQVLGKDIEMIRARIAESQKKVAEDQAMLNALMGAFQQCDAFVKELDDDTPTEESDVGNSPVKKKK
jgi:prefoldin subunit 5|tara:strand:+ start:189 stop:419 length:231 start_codon:yes stop_codon:yes gene_type:complete